ncbi:hypothetical protein HAX54_038833 [Datura stramonium]|uniref:HECT domain-containing protein n=1 Tax=Datura stramonium TaxID=4076 RepID=A0ABS8VNQ4_DATST|nr:hypothetical protein [Datura stramonium]
MYSSQKAVLDRSNISGEVGTGLGPTLEFYTLLSRDLQKVGLRMWRISSSSSEHSMEVVWMKIERGWQPIPKVIEYFRLRKGRMAKALQDGRLLDLPLSTAFYKLVLGQELDLYDIPLFHAELGKTLQELQALVSRRQYLGSIGGQGQENINDLHFLWDPSRKELWKAETLVDHIKFDHGYTAKSPAIVYVPGGWAVLNPKLTIVRKHSSSASNAAPNGNMPLESWHEDLPSVMTCANYLKLPPYSTEINNVQKLSCYQ